MFSQDEFNEFIRVVGKMRAAQNAFFSDRNLTNLDKAKAAEKQVDGWLNHFSEKAPAPDRPAEPIQKSMFDQTGPGR